MHGTHDPQDTREVRGPGPDLAGLASLIASSSTVGFVTTTLDGRILGHNQAFAALCATDDDLAGRAFVEMLVPGDRAHAVHVLRRAASGADDVRDLALRLRRPGTSPSHVLVTLAHVPDTEGSPAHLALLLQDDTERHATAEILTGRAHRATSLLRALPDAVLICAADGTVVEMNEQAEVMFGYTADELVGRPVETVVPTEHVAAHRWQRERFTATTHARPMITGPDVCARHKDGHEVPVEVNLAAAELESGPVVVASIRDVTTQRTQAAQLRDSLHLVSKILGAATEQAIFTIDLEGRIETFSRGAELLLGYDASEVLGRSATMFTPPDARARLADVWGLDPAMSVRERVEALVRSHVATTRPWTFLTKTHERRHVLLSLTVRTSGEVPDGLIIVATDQTQRQAQEAALAASEARFRNAFERAPIGVAMVSVEPLTLGRFLQVNAALVTMLGYDRAELLDAAVVDVTLPEDLSLLMSVLERLAAGEDVAELIEQRLLHADGHEVWVQASLAAVSDGTDNRAPYVLAMVTDITERRRAEAELSHHALHDALTGLPNRALVTEQLGLALARGKRNGTGVGVLYLDLDNFKDVNDSLGHTAGDELLVGVADRLTRVLRDTDTAARLGGDEFVVVCEDLHTVEELTAVADRVAQALETQILVAGQPVTMSASIGIAYTPTADGRPGDMLRDADIAMFRAKGNGRARYEFSDPELQVRALRQIELEADLRATLSAQHGALPAAAERGTGEQAAGEHAAAATDTLTAARPGNLSIVPTQAGGTPGPVRHPQEGRLFMVYQPCFSARTGRLVACEALLRWDHPTRGVLTPGQFLDVAEDRALMSPLGSWVLQDAAVQAAIWQAQFGDDAPDLWVNISAGQMGRNRFASRVADVLMDTGLEPGRLWLELTERQALSSAHSVLDDLNALPDMGVRLAIDDFGTGYAGMDLLRRLPVSALKIDASYVAAIGEDPTGAALVSTVVGLGLALGMQVVAEGVETDQQREAVSALGVDVLQGYLLGRPGPVEQIEQILLAQAGTDD